MPLSLPIHLGTLMRAVIDLAIEFRVDETYCEFRFEFHSVFGFVGWILSSSRVPHDLVLAPYLYLARVPHYSSTDSYVSCDAASSLLSRVSS
ncbi:MAG TPA: hypothetical protein VGO47_04730 [Chlamydiales bacterium]|nr:hypothetical protein [Chlamydiales bacterium]